MRREAHRRGERREMRREPGVWIGEGLKVWNGQKKAAKRIVHNDCEKISFNNTLRIKFVSYSPYRHLHMSESWD